MALVLPTISSMTASTRTRYVVNLGNAELIPLGEGREFQVGGMAIAVFRTRDGIFATQVACPHMGGPLADSLVGANVIVCPMHSCTYEIRTGVPVGHNYGTLRTFPATINLQGEILVTLEDHDPVVMRERS